MAGLTWRGLRASDRVHIDHRALPARLAQHPSAGNSRRYRSSLVAAQPRGEPRRVKTVSVIGGKSWFNEKSCIDSGSVRPFGAAGSIAG